ncbi:MAG: DegT/DnrJ/EryC1/StrS family aminotransferase [Fodinibius sp.]|nr:DegT/DnrJ/EryC1/StrS family aminotransferase [Fodinibius sp.]
MGLSQLQKADQRLQKRRDIARKYDEAFASIDGITRRKVSPQEGMSHHDITCM